MRRRKRVVVYIASTERGGAEISLRNLVGALDDSIEIIVMGVDRELCSWIAAARPNVAVEIVPPVRNKFAVRAFFAHRRAVRRLRPDIFQANLRDITDCRHALLAARTVRGVKVIAVDQLPLAPTSGTARRAAAFVSRRLDRRIAVGEQAARLAEQALNLPAHSVGTIYNGLPNGPDRLVRPPSTEMVAGTLARLDRIKGLDVLLDAIAALDVRLVIAGEGPERGALEQQAAALGERDRVQFVGWRDDTRAFLDDIDVFVLPSRNEGFPLSIIEAMFAGRPVIATPVGSVDEAVVDQETGLLVPADDVDALRSAIVALADDPDRRDLMGTNGRQRALEHFSISKMAGSFEALYDDLCSS